MAQLILHIGDPKTGSSSIQQVLFRRKVECLTRSYDYPARLSAARVAKTLHGKGRFTAKSTEFSDLAQWATASGADVAIVSAEQFSMVNAATVHDSFQEYLPEFASSMRVIAYVRPHVSRFISAYTQRTKVGQLSTDLESFLDAMIKKRSFLFSDRFQAWRGFFGDRFILRPMSRDDLYQGDVVADFLNLALDNAPFRILQATEANISLPLESLAGLRFVHKILRRNDVSPGTLHWLGSRINTLVTTKAQGKGTKVRISRAMYDRLRDHCLLDAETLDREFFSRPIMVSALERAAEDTTSEPQLADTYHFFEPGVIRTLRKYATILAKLLAAFPGVWKEQFLRDFGQTDKQGQDDFPPAAEIAHVQEVEEVLGKIVLLIAPA